MRAYLKIKKNDGYYEQKIERNKVKTTGILAGSEDFKTLFLQTLTGKRMILYRV